MPQVKSAFKRYECNTDHGTRKFWEIEKLDDPDNPDTKLRYGYTTYWGRIGNKGSSKTKWFTNLYVRNNHYQDKIREKHGKGYILITQSDQSPYQNKQVEEVREEDTFLKTLHPDDADRLRAIELDFE